MKEKLAERVGLAIKMWNKAARKNGGAVTLRKTDSRFHQVKQFNKILPQMDWSDRDSWKRYFTAVFAVKDEIEKLHPSKDFRVTLDWALASNNVKMVVRHLAKEQAREARKARVEAQEAV